MSAVSESLSLVLGTIRTYRHRWRVARPQNAAILLCVVYLRVKSAMGATIGDLVKTLP